MARQLVYKRHAVRRMASRYIEDTHVAQAVEAGEIIESYPNDFPYPSRLILVFIGSRPIHVVAADNPDSDETYIITAYEPELEEWDSSFRRRLSS